MTRHQAVFYRRLLYLYDVVVSVVAFFAALSVRAYLEQVQSEGGLAGGIAVKDLNVADYYGLLWGLLPLWLTSFYFADTSDFRIQYLPLAGRYIRAVAIGIALFVAATFVFKVGFVSRSFVIIFGIVQFVALILGRITLLEAVRHGRREQVDGHRVLVVGVGKQAQAFARTVRTEAPWNNKLVGHVRLDGAASVGAADNVVVVDEERIIGQLSKLDEILDSRPVDEVVFAVPDQEPHVLEEALRFCDERGVDVLMTMPPDVPSHTNIEVAKVTGYDLPMIGMRRAAPAIGRLVLKRLLDLSGCLFGLFLVGPILVATAIAIRIESPGPVFFKQVRAGKHGRKFTMYKFRSMVADAEAKKKELMHLNEMEGPVFKIKEDPRITKVGRFIRKTSIDELPQLFNVLLGHMSLVGPRPPLPSEVAEYEPWQRRRLSVKPGITGLWQVSGRNNVDFDEWMELDLRYIDTWSLWSDLRILFKTIPVVLFSKGAS